MKYNSLILAGALLSGAVCAEQLNFKKTSTSEGMTFSYEWIDADHTLQNISFHLPKSAFEDTPVRQANYKPKIAHRHVTVALLKAAKKVDPKDARVKITPTGDSVDIKVSGGKTQKVDDVLQHLQGVQQSAFDQYLEERYFTRFTTLFNQRAIKPDHLRYIKESIKPLIPASQAFYEKVKQNANTRDYFALLLSWIQSIPYNTLEDRVASNGSGFAPPIGLLIQNLGDCDSKAVLASSMVRAFLPTTKMIMVFLPNHALLGIALTAKPEDKTIEHEGQAYILYDPTGPALIPFGQISEETERYIATGRFQIEEIE
ncbi:hypothetical protein [Alteromonas sp. D210916BOD_24]|uniref:hypothetical protein n=1 Tax=Alteromonas sp. D210916BOD_24 TaxID=3157618 RepID=UPI00399CBE91